MKAVILAGGKGTRISEESRVRPKPMVEIGGKPILWHIMRHYADYGITDFIVCCGYKGHMIKEYFVNYYRHAGRLEVRLGDGGVEVGGPREPWRVTLVDTGLETMTAGRILRARPYIGEETFMLTYGDGVSDVDLDALLECHRSHGAAVTISTMRAPGRFGALRFDEEKGLVSGFKEKAREDQSWINIGYMVMESKAYGYLGDGSAMLEAEPFECLANDGQMAAYRHTGFWSPMDTVHDREYLERIWARGGAPWAGRGPAEGDAVRA